MNVTFDDKDLERIATLVASKLEDRVISSAMSGVVWEAIERRGRQWADTYLASRPDMYAMQEQFEAVLNQWISKNAPGYIQQVVEQTMGDTDSLKRGIYEQVVKSAVKSATDRFNQVLDTEEE